jgi:heme/copper-type cytochrome/quinol oxidase subunit 3
MPGVNGIAETVLYLPVIVSIFWHFLDFYYTFLFGVSFTMEHRVHSTDGW